MTSMVISGLEQYNITVELFMQNRLKIVTIIRFGRGGNITENS